MKKILSLILAVMLFLVVMAGCAPKKAGGASSIVAAVETNFEKPETYASVVLVTINPQFRLYLDAEGIVLAVEPINADAKSINKKIEFKDKKVDAVVQNLVVAANDSGFIKENATVDIKIASVKADDNTTEILNTVKTSVTTKLGELKVVAEVTAEVSQDILAEVEVPSEGTSSEAASSEENSSQDSSSKDNSSTQSTNTSTPTANKKPTCLHLNAKAVSVNTGKNIIDTSKLDAVNHKVVCDICNKDLGVEAHKIKDGKCTLCNQNNLKTKTSSIISAGPTLQGDLAVNIDGTPDFDVMVDACWYSAVTPEYTVDEWNYKIPADAMLKAIREYFVITDAQFEKLKAQGEYKFFIGTHTFKDGYFYISWPAAGGPGNYTHEQVGYIDDKAGKFTVYYDYISGGADSDEHEHISYYAVEYTYSGYSNLAIQKNEWYKEIVGFESVVDSMRVTSIKAVSSLPSNMTKC